MKKLLICLFAGIPFICNAQRLEIEPELYTIMARDSTPEHAGSIFLTLPFSEQSKFAITSLFYCKYKDGEFWHTLQFGGAYNTEHFKAGISAGYEYPDFQFRGGVWAYWSSHHKRFESLLIVEQGSDFWMKGVASFRVFREEKFISPYVIAVTEEGWVGGGGMISIGKVGIFVAPAWNLNEENNFGCIAGIRMSELSMNLCHYKKIAEENR